MSLVPLPELFFWTPSRFGFIPRPFVISFRSGRENRERFNLKEVTTARAEGKDKYIKSANGGVFSPFVVFPLLPAGRTG